MNQMQALCSEKGGPEKGWWVSKLKNRQEDQKRIGAEEKGDLCRGEARAWASWGGSAWGGKGVVAKGAARNAGWGVALVLVQDKCGVWHDCVLARGGVGLG